GSVYAGLAQLFRLLRNARGVDRSRSLGPAAITGRPVASVENTTSPSCGTDRTAGLWGTAQYGRQRPWSLASCPEQSPLSRALHCPIQIARPPLLDRRGLAQLLEPPYTDPYVRWCGRGGAERLPPIPISGTKRTCRLRRPMSAFRGAKRTWPEDGVRSAFDAVDGAHSAASRCPRGVASKRTT